VWTNQRKRDVNTIPHSYPNILRFTRHMPKPDSLPQSTFQTRSKYLPLRASEPGWYLTLGGELRERFEGNYNPDFGIGGNGPDSYWLQRITLLSDVHLGERLRVFAEGISGVIEGENPPASPVQDDPIDLQFAFVDVVPYLKEEESLTLRGGRFGMSLGSGRLVATRAAPNIPLRFDGGELIYSRPLWEATAFITRPVKDTGGIEELFPVRTFFLEGCGAKTDLNPGADAVLRDSSLLHVVQILVTCHGALAQATGFNGLQERLLFARLHFRFHQIPHTFLRNLTQDALACLDLSSTRRAI
jgi:hypothetical protein